MAKVTFQKVETENFLQDKIDRITATITFDMGFTATVTKEFAYASFAERDWVNEVTYIVNNMKEEKVK